MRDANPGTIYLKDYQAPAYLINRTELHFELGEEETIVTSRLHRLRAVPDDVALEPQGQELELLRVSVDNEVLPEEAYTVTDSSLVVHKLPEQRVLSCKTRIKPQDNTSLEGLQVLQYVLHPV